jgi:hypothetical protein
MADVVPREIEAMTMEQRFTAYMKQHRIAPRTRCERRVTNARCKQLKAQCQGLHSAVLLP